MTHTITLLPGEKSFSASDDQDILDAALQAGLSLPYGCRNGACRSCRARLRSGRVARSRGKPDALSGREREQGYLLLCQSRALSDLRLEAEELDPGGLIKVRTLPVRLAGKRQLAHDVMELSLGLPEGERLHFLAGQYLDILLRDGRRRAFSIASPPSRTGTLELHVRHVAGGSFSGHVFGALRERSLLRITGPLGSFHLRPADRRRVILVAGGTGFAPIKSMVEDALARDLEMPIHLYWGVRARRDLYLHSLAAGWARAHPDLHYVPVLSEPAAGDAWEGRTGLVHQAVLDDFPDLADASVYVSGPPPMVDAARDAFPARGADPAHMHSDSFDYAFETGHDD